MVDIISQDGKNKEKVKFWELALLQLENIMHKSHAA